MMSYYENQTVNCLLSHFPSLKDNTNTLTITPEHKAQIFNTHFQSVYTQEDDQIPNMPHSPFPNIPPLDITTNGVKKLQDGLDTFKSI